MTDDTPAVNPLTVRDALAAMLDSEGYGAWINADVCADVLNFLDIEAGLSLTDVRRWMESGPKWDRLLRDAMAQSTDGES